MITSKRLLSIVSALGALSAAACGSSSSSSAPGSSAGGGGATSARIGILLSGDPGSLDPQLSITPGSEQIAQFAYDPLVNVASNGTIVSGLAARWHQRGSALTLILHSGITCSDGSAFTAHDVVDNIDFVANPKSHSPLLGVAVPPGVRARAHGAGTVTLTTASPAPFLLQGLALLPMVCTRGLHNRDLLRTQTDGTGPYHLLSAVPGSAYTLGVRKGYAWGPAGKSSASLPSHVVFRVVNDPSTAANLLLDGTDQVGEVAGPDEQRLNAAGLFKVSQRAAFAALWFNAAARHPTAQGSVRRALVEAANLPQLRSVATSGQGEAPRSLIATAPPVCPEDDVTGVVPDYSPAAAKQSLGDVHTTLNLIYPSSLGPGMPSAAELAVHQWQQAGVSVHAQGMSDAQFQGAIFGGGAWDIAIVPTGVQNPSQLVPLVSGPPPPHGENFAHIDNSTYDRLSTQAERMSGRAGCPEWSAAEKALISSADAVPFADASTVFYGHGVRFSLVHGLVVPTSLQ